MIFPVAIDTFSLTFAALAVYLTITVSIYTPGYDDHMRGYGRFIYRTFPWAFCLFSCLGVLSGNWFLFTIFVELSSLVLFFMISISDTSAAKLYLLSQLAGASLLLTGTAMLYSATGSTAIGPVPRNCLWLFLCGLGIKAAFPVLHFWLPAVHSRAATPTSALLSGFAVKIGVFGTGRLVSADTGPTLLLLGSIMAVYGVGRALIQHDAKRLLAWHTISQLGYIVAAFGVGTPLGFAAGFFHAIAHGLFKALLFLSAGSLEKVCGTKDLKQLGGAARTTPLTFVFFLVGALAISGCPGFSGFASKAMIKAALHESGNTTCYWILQAVGAGTVVSFCKMGYMAFLRKPVKNPARAPGKRSDNLRNLGMVLPAFATIILGMVPGFFAEPGGLDTHYLFKTANILSATTTLALGLGLFVFLRKWLETDKDPIPDADMLVEKGVVIFGNICSTLQTAHCGMLRVYIAVTVGTWIVLSLLLR